MAVPAGMRNCISTVREVAPPDAVEGEVDLAGIVEAMLQIVGPGRS